MIQDKMSVEVIQLDALNLSMEAATAARFPKQVTIAEAQNIVKLATSLLKHVKRGMAEDARKAGL